MTDILLTCVVAGIFYAGFKAGNKWKSVAEMLRDGLKAFD